MANSATYISQTSALNENLQSWANFVSNINQIISSYQVTITALQEQINNNLASIEGLQTYIEAVSKKIESIPEYVKLDNTSMEIKVSSKTSYTKSIGVFSNANKVYVYSNRTVNGLTLAGKKVTSGEAIYSFDGTISGDKLLLTATNISKTSNVILSFNRTGNASDNMDASILVKLAYEQVSIPNISVQTSKVYTAVIGKFSDAVAALEQKTVENTEIKDKLNSSILSEADTTIKNLTQQLGITVQSATVLSSTSSTAAKNAIKSAAKNALLR